jgi:membrane-bound acyltransferase YfiQ involved in biofilm formation
MTFVGMVADSRLSYIIRWIRTPAFIVAVCIVVTYFVIRDVKAPMLEVISKYTLQIMFLDSFFKTVLFMLLPRICGNGVWLIPLETILDVALCVVACVILERIPIVSTMVGLDGRL